MIRWLYEKRLLSGLSILPSHICFMITAHDMEEDPGKIVSVCRWCVEITGVVRPSAKGGGNAYEQGGIEGVTFHISTEGSPENPGVYRGASGQSGSLPGSPCTIEIPTKLSGME